MIAQNHPTAILCGGGSPAKATFICFQTDCSAYALLCGNEECQCVPPHRKHVMQSLEGLREELTTPPKLPEAYTNAEKSINGLIDSCLGDLQKLKIRHNEHIDRQVNSYRKFDHLRQKLISG
jgi:hypothetical protein